MLRLLIEKERKTYVVDANMTAVADQNGVCLVIVSRVSDGYEVLTVADGELFDKRVQLLAARFPEIKSPTTIKVIG